VINAVWISISDPVSFFEMQSDPVLNCRIRLDRNQETGSCSTLVCSNVVRRTRASRNNTICDICYLSALQPVCTVHPRVHQNMRGVHHYERVHQKPVA